MAKPIEPIPVLTGKAAAWFTEFLKKGDKPDPERDRQAREDDAIVARMRPLDRKKHAQMRNDHLGPKS